MCEPNQESSFEAIYGISGLHKFVPFDILAHFCGYPDAVLCVCIYMRVQNPIHCEDVAGLWRALYFIYVLHYFEIQSQFFNRVQ